MLRRGKIEPVEIAGRRFLRWHDVINYPPAPDGEPTAANCKLEKHK